MVVRGAKRASTLSSMSFLDRALRMGEAKKFKSYEQRVGRINAYEPEMESSTDEELRELADELRERAQDGESLDALLPDLLPALQKKLAQKGKATGQKLAYHPPCTLQHGQQLRGGVEACLRELGFDIRLASCDPHLCCGSAGTYSVLQPELAKQLRDQKLAALAPIHADAIVSANIGCIAHLQSGTATPVRHWIELIDRALGAE